MDQNNVKGELFDFPTMAVLHLTDDLILEIIARLPLRYAIRCLLLNRTFFRWISEPSFRRRLLSSSSPTNNTTICCYGRNTFTRITREISTGHISHASTTLTLTLEPSILASCKGVVLLRFRDFSHYVFNPITGGIMHVDYPLSSLDNVGLAVNLDAQNPNFKLVTARRIFSITKGGVRFSVVVPSSSGVGQSMLVKSRVEIDCETSIMLDMETHPVYVQGCLHWLETQGKQIMVFDVEKEEARIINGPVKNNEPGLLSGGKYFIFVDKWFGFADGSLQFVCHLGEEIAILSHNCLRDEWQVKHKINGNVCYPSDDYGYIRDRLSFFFDGQRLFVIENRQAGVVLIYDILNDKWEKTGKIYVQKGAPFNQRFFSFFSFFPTLAKVSENYLHNFEPHFPWWVSAGRHSYKQFKNSLEGLQQLLL